jgi:hypothetical protein
VKEHIKEIELHDKLTPQGKLGENFYHFRNKAIRNTTVKTRNK